MPVLYTQHFPQFFDNSGDPLSGGLLYTYAAGTTTPKATYTSAAGDTQHTNPIVLNSVGIPSSGPIFLEGSYKFVLHDSNDVPLAGRTTDNVTAFTATGNAAAAFDESFSGNDVLKTFTLSEDLGSDEKLVMLFVDNSNRNFVANGTFDTDTIWTKGAGWTIAAGAGTATGAISTALSQTAAYTIQAGVLYTVKYTVTRAAGGVIASVGGVSGTERTADGTYTETILAGSTQTIAFTGNAFTGTVDAISVKAANGKGFEIQPTTAFSMSGTTLTLVDAPASGTSNIRIIAPSRLVTAAAAAADAADAASSSAAASVADALTQVAAAATLYSLDSASTTMADPGTGKYRLNNATVASVTAIAIDAQSAFTGNADYSDFVATWGSGTSAVKGQICIRKKSAATNFIIYNITGAVVDNGGWLEIPVAYVDNSGSFSNGDSAYFQFSRTGDKGDTGATGATGATGSISDFTGIPTATIATGDYIPFQDVSASNATKKCTLANLLALAQSGLVLLGSYTASNATSVDIGSGLDLDAAINGTYDEYELHIVSLVPVTDGSIPSITTSTDGGANFDSSSGAYDWATGGVGGSATTLDDDSNSDTAIRLVPDAAGNVQVGNAAGESFNAIVRIKNPTASTLFTQMEFSASYIMESGEICALHGSGARMTAANVDALRVFMDTGNIASGTFYLYGIRKS